MSQTQLKVAIEALVKIKSVVLDGQGPYEELKNIGSLLSKAFTDMDIAYHEVCKDYLKKN